MISIFSFIITNSEINLHPKNWRKINSIEALIRISSIKSSMASIDYIIHACYMCVAHAAHCIIACVTINRLSEAIQHVITTIPYTIMLPLYKSLLLLSRILSYNVMYSYISWCKLKMLLNPVCLPLRRSLCCYLIGYMVTFTQPWYPSICSCHWSNDVLYYKCSNALSYDGIFIVILMVTAKQHLYRLFQNQDLYCTAVIKNFLQVSALYSTNFLHE